ncbi:MAG: hypothetical protein L3J59_12915 [Methylococcaceae bacterium]|nr:hypothetical protein [Methylococcaceae bacterium]
MENIKQQSKKVLILGSSIYLTISLMIIYYNHHFYDDEIFNLRKMPFSLSEIFFKAQSEDVHPPLSYILNKLIYELLSSYKAILVFSILLNVCALTYFYKYAVKELDNIYSKLLLFMFVFINSGLLLWTNSVRWYAYWIPLFIFLYTNLFKYKSELSCKHFAILGLLLSFMTYLSYLTLLLLIIIFLLLFCYRRNDFKIKNIFTFSAIYLSLSSYQIYIFFTVHIHNRDHQINDFIESLLNAIYGIINGGSVFIVSPIFVVFFLFTLVIIIKGGKSFFADKNSPHSLLVVQSIFLLIGLVTLMIIIGVSGKYRNNIALSIPFYFILSHLLSYIENINIKRLYVYYAAVFLISSTFNLITHQNTAKNSYNMPITKLISFLHPPENKITFSFDPVIDFHLKNKQYETVDVYNENPKNILIKGSYIYLIKTYQGALSNNHYYRILKLYKKIENCMKNTRNKKIGTHSYYKIKNMLSGRKPKVDQFQIYITHGKIKENCTITKT